MKKPTSDHSGVLIVHLWVEERHPEGLRARITQMLSSSTAEQSIAVAASADDICAVVKRWVEDLARSYSRSSDVAVTPLRNRSKS